MNQGQGGRGGIRPQGQASFRGVSPTTRTGGVTPVLRTGNTGESSTQPTSPRVLWRGRGGGGQ